MLATRNGQCGYEDILGSINSTVVIGGRDIDPSQFVPAMNLSAHNDEAWVDINHTDSPMVSRVDTINGGVVSCECGDFRHEFQSDSSSLLKWDMLFSGKAAIPAEINFTLTHSLNLSFYKQPDVAPDGSAFESPQVAGSYAVYMNKRDNRYQTGKVMHIYSPYLLDRAHNRSPLLTMTMSDVAPGEKQLVMSLNAEVLQWIAETAVEGEFRLDPDIGYSTKGSTQEFVPTVPLFNKPYQASIDGDVTDLYMYALVPVQSGKWCVAECGGGPDYSPEGLSVVVQGTSESYDDDLGDDLYHWDISAGASLVENTYYRIGTFRNPSGSNWRLYFDTTGSYTRATRYAPFDYATEFLDPTGSIRTSVTTDREYSIWAAYESAAGGGLERACERGIMRGVMRGVC